MPSSEAKFAESDDVLATARAMLAHDGLTVGDAELHRSVSASANSDTNIVTVTASSAKPERASAITNAVVAAYRQETLAVVQGTRDNALKGIDDARNRLMTVGYGAPPGSAVAQSTAEALARLETSAGQLLVDGRVFGDGVRFVSQAKPQNNRLGLSRGVPAGAAIGLLLAMAVAFVRADRPGRYVDAAVTRTGLDYDGVRLQINPAFAAVSTAGQAVASTPSPASWPTPDAPPGPKPAVAFTDDVPPPIGPRSLPREVSPAHGAPRRARLRWRLKAF